MVSIPTNSTIKPIPAGHEARACCDKAWYAKGTACGCLHKLLDVSDLYGPFKEFFALSASTPLNSATRFLFAAGVRGTLVLIQ
jgi:hypothetical protein